MTTHEYLEEWLIDNRVPTFNEFDTARRKALAVEKNRDTENLAHTYRFWNDEDLKDEWLLLIALCSRENVGVVTTQLRKVLDMMHSPWALNGSAPDDFEKPNRPTRMTQEYLESA